MELVPAVSVLLVMAGLTAGLIAKLTGEQLRLLAAPIARGA